VFNPVDRLRFGAVGCEFCYPYSASIIPAKTEAVQPPVVAAVAEASRTARPISCACFVTAVVQIVRFVPARATVGSSASETAVQSAPASSGSRHFSPRNKAIKALTHWPHCARHPQAA